MPFDLDKQLPKETFNKIISCCTTGDFLLGKKKFDEAVSQYEIAMSLIPAPKEIWHAYAWLLVALAETHFLNSDFQKALNYYTQIKETQESEKMNPLIHLRLAQCHFKLGKFREAEHNLKNSDVPYDLSELESPIYWDIIRGITIRDDLLPFNTLA